MRGGRLAPPPDSRLPIFPWLALREIFPTWKHQTPSYRYRAPLTLALARTCSTYTVGGGAGPYTLLYYTTVLHTVHNTSYIVLYTVLYEYGSLIAVSVAVLCAIGAGGGRKISCAVRAQHSINTGIILVPK